MTDSVSRGLITKGILDAGSNMGGLVLGLPHPEQERRGLEVLDCRANLKLLCHLESYFKGSDVWPWIDKPLL